MMVFVRSWSSYEVRLSVVRLYRTRTTPPVFKTSNANLYHYHVKIVGFYDRAPRRATCKNTRPQIIS
jgi:hypothetical protein